MALLGCVLNMMLLCVSAIIALELMALSLVLGAPGAPQTDYITHKWANIFDCSLIFRISAVYGPIRLCFGYDAPIGPFYHDPIDQVRGPSWEDVS